MFFQCCHDIKYSRYKDSFSVQSWFGLSFRQRDKTDKSVITCRLAATEDYGGPLKHKIIFGESPINLYKIKACLGKICFPRLIYCDNRWLLSDDQPLLNHHLLVPQGWPLNGGSINPTHTSETLLKFLVPFIWLNDALKWYMRNVRLLSD